MTILDPDTREHLEGEGFHAEEIQSVERWVAFVASKLDQNIENAERIRRAVSHLIPFVMEQYAAENVVLYPGQLGTSVCMWSEAEKAEMLMLTGDILLAAADGPQVGSRYMNDCIDRLEAVALGR